MAIKHNHDSENKKVGTCYLCGSQDAIIFSGHPPVEEIKCDECKLEYKTSLEARKFYFDVPDKLSKEAIDKIKDWATKLYQKTNSPVPIFCPLIAYFADNRVATLDVSKNICPYCGSWKIGPLGGFQVGGITRKLFDCGECGLKCYGKR